MNKKRVGKWIIAGAILAGVFLVAGKVKEQKMTASISEKVVRFHVLANSDSEEDQAVKLKVRDAVGSYLEGVLSEADSKEESEEMITAQMEKIEEISTEVLQENGFTYGVSASLGECVFPEKTYGCYTFQPGTYEALEICLGNAGGHNWWCVLYPNLCFTSECFEEKKEESDKLKNILTEEEYNFIMENSDCHIGFRCVELFQEVYEAVTGNLNLE